MSLSILQYLAHFPVLIALHASHAYSNRACGPLSLGVDYASFSSEGEFSGDHLYDHRIFLAKRTSIKKTGTVHHVAVTATRVHMAA